MFCENCGNKIPDDSVFCEECGAKTEPDAPASVQKQTPAPVPVPPSPVYLQPQAYVPPPVPQQPVGYYGVQQPRPKKKSRAGLVIIIIAVFLAVVGVGGYFGIRALTDAGIISFAGTPFEQKPSPGDFGWFIRGGYSQGMPNDAAALTSFEDIKGEWKAVMLIDPDHKVYQTYSYMIAKVTISGSADSLIMTWSYIDYYDEDGSKKAYSGSDDYMGMFDAGKGLGAGEEEDYFEIPYFWEKNGKQYAAGFNTVPSGEEEIYVGLIRP